MLIRIVPLITFLFLVGLAVAKDPNPQYLSPFMRVELAPDQPAFQSLALDSLGKGKLTASPFHSLAPSAKAYEVRPNGSKFEYRPVGAPAVAPPAWTFEFSGREMHLHSSFNGESPPPPLKLNFDLNATHATLLGLMNDDGSVVLPALLHLPSHGTLRITSNAPKGLALGYDALRYSLARRAEDYVKVTFPAASPSMPELDYTLEVVAIYPKVPGVEDDPRFDGFRRNWLGIFQLNPRIRLLATHAGSDGGPIDLYAHSSMAALTPPLAPGLTALDLVRQTLDRYLSGYKGYGMSGYKQVPFPEPAKTAATKNIIINDPANVPYNFLDVYPSLLIAASDYVRASNDKAWLEKNYAGVKDWATKLLALDTDGDGLFKYAASGNSGSWPEQVKVRPANWWDTVGFGHEDAYSNALAYPGLLGMSELARRVNQPEDAALYAASAEKLRSAYYNTFYNPATGVLAGWKSADGKLHDYYFTFVNSMAITYGLVPKDKANQIMDRLLAKMKEVGYSHFEYGLPGNLIPIRREDYVDKDPRWGGPAKADGSDGFQIYQNGGARATFAIFTIKSLYLLGRQAEGDAILFPMLRSIENGTFEGGNGQGMMNDWRAWDGTPHGYEGFSTGAFRTLLAVLAR